MGYGTSLGTAHEDEMSYVLEKGLTDKQLSDQKEMATNQTTGDFQSRFYATDQSTMPLEASRKLTDALKSYGSTYPLPVDDRRNEDTNSPKWENVSGTLKQIAVGAGNYLWGTPQIPEAPVSNLSRQLGHEDIKIEPNAGRSLLHRAIDDVQYGANIFGFAKGEAWSDKLTEEGTPSKGTTIVNKLLGTGGEERYQTWPERLARSAFTLPGDVLSGKVEPGSIQEIERATDLASLMVMGPAPVAAKLADGTLGSFAGVKSKSLPKDKLYEAQNMELDMMHPDDIWEKTGFFRGADSRWRYEIPDTDAKLKMDAFDTIIEQPTQAQLDSITWTPQGDNIVPKKFWYEGEGKSIPETGTLQEKFDAWVKGETGKAKPLTLDRVIDHPELFKAYPELATMKVNPLPKFLEDRGIHGQVSGDTIYLAPGHPEYIRGVLLHEIQHGIQRHEGFAYGGIPEQFLPKELPQAEKEFLAIKQSEEPKIEQDLNKKPLVLAFGNKVEYAKNYIRAEQNGTLSTDAKAVLNRLKAEKPEAYRKLSNIVKSETLLKQAKEEAFTKYRRLMGEVEARNVQARRNFSDNQRQWMIPTRTEDVPKFLQHNPK